MEHALRLYERVVVVTGGGSENGRDIVRALAAEGARIAIADRDFEAACRVRDEVARKGCDARAFKADVVNKNEVDDLVRVTIRELGWIHIWVSVASTAAAAPFPDITERDWDSVGAVNIKSALLGAQAAAKTMILQKSGGKIINVLSQGGAGDSLLSTEPLNLASKLAIIGLTQSLAEELRPYEITVNAVCTGNVEAGVLDEVIEDGGRLLSRVLGEYPKGVQRSVVQGGPDNLTSIPQAVLMIALRDTRPITGKTIRIPLSVMRIGKPTT